MKRSKTQKVFMLFGALNLKISKRKVQTKVRNFTHQNAAYLWETPIGGRMEAVWGQCTRSYFHEYPL